MEPYYERDGITIYHGDCREILPELPAVDLLLTDPPYGINWMTPVGPSRGPGRKVSGDTSLIDILPIIAHPSATAVVWGGNYYAHVLPPTNSWLIWDKRVTDWSNDQSDCEMAWTNLPQPARIFRKNWGGGGCAAMENGAGVGYIHPTQKPVDLMRWCIQQAKKSETILDPFMGSGTTLVAAKLNGRQAIGIEIEERYCEIAAKRLAQGVLF